MTRTHTVSCVAALLVSAAGAAAVDAVFRPGQLWPDNNGVHINAHAGGFLYHESTYYWFGESFDRGARGVPAIGVSCYSSKDLYNWKDEGLALDAAKADPSSVVARGNVIERPKVIYNRKTRKFVMWFHTELRGRGYDAAQTTLAVADHVAGPYVVVRSLRPDAGTWPLNMPADQKEGPIPEGVLEQGSTAWISAAMNGGIVRRDFRGGQMARDMTLFVDDDGTAYHIHASEENATIHISQLTDDYLAFSGKWVRAFPGGHNEAPAVFKYRGKYYMITSGCTGAKPNAARSGVADSMLGEWRSLGNPVRGTQEQADITFGSQSTAVLPVAGKPGALIFVGDFPPPNRDTDGRYLWLPIQWEGDKPILKWMDQWSLRYFR